MDQEYLNEFINEANELLEEAESALLIMESKPDITQEYNMVFRAFHSLKGAAGMMGLDDIQRHMHLSEDLFQSFSEDHEGLRKNIDFFLDSVDHAKLLVRGEKASFEYNLNSVAEIKSEEKAEPATNVEDIKVVTTKKTQSFSYSQKYNVIFISNGENTPEVFGALEKNINLVRGNEEFEFNKLDQYDLVVFDSTMLSKEIENKITVPFVAYSKDEIKTKDYMLMIDNSSTADEIMQLAFLSSRIMKLQVNQEKAIRLLMYQYTDLDKYLKQKGRDLVRNTIKLEIKSIMNMNKEILKDAA